MPTANSKLPTDQIKRCSWCGTDELYVKYHDEEWGKVVHDDKILFEFLVLESAQAGLSWITILRRRENYRKAFADFDVHKVAAFTDEDVERLMQDAGIIRNRLKILATITNAQNFIKVQQEFGSFDKYLYSLMPDGKPINNYDNKLSASTPISDAISKDMKKRGFKFFGTTICYAHMQATGMVNDHINECSFK
jgi:DNA-3-methyladenine glycosylase I